MTNDEEVRAEVLRELREILQTLGEEAKHPTHVLRFPSGPQEDLNEERVQMVRRITEQTQSQGGSIVLPAGQPFEHVQALPSWWPMLERLAWLLGLTDTERGFVEAVMENPRDKTNLLAFADWLEE